MSSVDDALENVVWAAADEFLSENLDEILDEVFERVYEEDTDDLEGIVEEVVSEWLSRSYVYDQIQTYIDEQIDDECMYSDDCMDIITDYGFSDSLAAAQEMGVWPAGTQAVEHGRRTCGGCDFSDMDETAVASAVLHQNLPSLEELQEEIVSQILDTSDYRDQLLEYEDRIGVVF